VPPPGRHTAKKTRAFIRFFQEHLAQMMRMTAQ